MSSNDMLRGMAAIITGGGQGIGAAIAKAYAKAGAKIVITGRTLSKLESVAAEIRELGGTVRILGALAGNRTDAKKTVDEAISVARQRWIVGTAGLGQDARPAEVLFEIARVAALYAVGGAELHEESAASSLELVHDPDVLKQLGPAAHQICKTTIEK